MSARPFSISTPYVSLFMSEWIEMTTGATAEKIVTVSLFMSEWIEIAIK
ncbi:MAG: hypothetical protein ACRC0Q_00260 [Kurthia gibsonii]